MWKNAIIKVTSDLFWCIGENKLHFPIFRKPVICTDKGDEMINKELHVK